MQVHDSQVFDCWSHWICSRASFFAPFGWIFSHLIVRCCSLHSQMGEHFARVCVQAIFCYHSQTKFLVGMHSRSVHYIPLFIHKSHSQI